MRTNEEILRELLARKEVVIFLGPDLPENLTGVPGWPELAERLAERGRFSAADWSTVAARYEQAVGRRDLIEWLDGQISGRTAGPIYPVLAALPVSKYIAATYDELLQTSLKTAGPERTPNIVVGEADLNFVKAGRPTVIKFLGEVSPGRLDTLLLTAGDIQNLPRQRAKILAQEVHPAMTGQTLLILGQNVNSELFRTLYYQGQDNALKRRAYAIWSGLEDWEKTAWNDAGLTIIEADPLEFATALSDSVKGSVKQNSDAVIQESIKKYLKSDIDALLLQRELLSDKLNVLEKQRILETRADVKFSLDHMIKEEKAKRDAIDRQLEALLLIGDSDSHA